MSTFLPFYSQVEEVQAAAVGCPSNRFCLYLPKVTRQVSDDLQLNSIEVTQAVQDAQNSIPLVAGRATMIRLYARSVGTAQPVSNVKVSVTAASAATTLNNASQAYVTTVPLSNDRAALQSTINIPLPASWLSGTVDLTIRLDPDNQVAEMSESNNTITHRLVFQDVPSLKIMVVPIRYVNTKNGRTYPAPTNDTISDWIMRTYPINRLEMMWRSTPYTFTGDLSSSADFIRLLNEITTLKTTEKAPAHQVYYALVPTSDGTSSWFYGGVAGIGWVGSRTAVGLDLSGNASQIAAHEIGHNMGMGHTPCGGPADPDPSFPYGDGSIGQYGLDVQANQLYATTTKDVMSYCNPKWISDYTYRKLFNAQVRSEAGMMTLAAAQPADQGLLVRAQISDGAVELQPAYVLPGATSQPEPGDYLVQLLDVSGQVLNETSVRAYEAETEDEKHVFGINTIVPLPSSSAASFRLVKDGQVLAEQLLNATVEQPNVSESASGLNVRWADEKPALVRYSEDGGATWTTLGIDVLGGELALRADLPENAIVEVIPAGISK